jgi:hypothetical protein
MESQTLQAPGDAWAVHLRSHGPVERRDVPIRQSLARRVAAEFEEMPGMRLTLAQAARFFGVPAETCSRILSRLMDDGHLHLTLDGRYVSRLTMVSRLLPRR